MTAATTTSDANPPYSCNQFRTRRISPPIGIACAPEETTPSIGTSTAAIRSETSIGLAHLDRLPRPDHAQIGLVKPAMNSHTA